MKLKSFLLPLITVVAMAAWAFTPPMGKGKIIRTKKGTIIVTQDAKMSNDDAKKIISILKNYGETAGYVRYFEGKRAVTYGALKVEDLRGLEKQFSVNLLEGRSPMGYFLVDKKVHKDAIDEKVVSGFKASSEIGKRIRPILRKYE